MLLFKELFSLIKEFFAIKTGNSTDLSQALVTEYVHSQF